MHKTFWDFSLHTYQHSKVQEACLTLQNRYRVDVNMLLYCLWFAQTRGALQADGLGEALTFSQGWAAQTVQPLRQIRTWMKIEAYADPRVAGEACVRLREKVKAAELAAEKMQQDALAALAAVTAEQSLQIAEQLAAAGANLRQYFAAAGIVMDAGGAALLAVVLKAALPEAGDDAVAQACTASYC